MAATEYRGFKYEKVGDGVWRLTLPSKLKGLVQASTDDDTEIKTVIDQTIETAGEGG